MILNVSGRTDIVAFYTPWFMNRYHDGFVDVRNPFYPKKVSRIYFKDVELIVFCTKNPLPIIPYLNEIKEKIVFHVTLTPYKKDIEPNVIDKNKIIAGIKKVSEVVGIDNTYVRYDPILINETYTLDYHIKAFEKMCNLLDAYIKHIIISFVDLYKNVLNNASVLNLKPLTINDYEYLAESFGKIAKKHGILIQTCYENIDLSKYGISSEPCMSKEYAYKLTGKKYRKWQARKCNCVEMVDIGAYNTCNHLCKYCYANYNESQVKKNVLKHNPDSSLILGELEIDDEIKIRQK